MQESSGTANVLPGFLIQAAGFCWCLAVAVFLFAYVLPRKGVEFSDEGWVLSASLGAARGWHLDPVTPQAPLWALNAPLIAAGVDGYLALRTFFYFVISGCVALAMMAVAPSRRLNGTGAALVTFAGLTTLSSLTSYNTTPDYLVLGGVALILLAADDGEAYRRRGMAVIAGLTLAAAGFLNFTMYPAVVLALAMVWLATPRRESVHLAALVMTVASVIAIAWYLHRIGIGSFVRFPGGHRIDTHRWIPAVRLVGEWIAIGAGIRAACSLVTRRTKGAPSRDLIESLAVLAVNILFVGCLARSLGVSGTGWIVPPMRWANDLHLATIGTLQTGLPPHVIALWGVAIVLLSLILAGRDDNGRRVLLLAACLFVCYGFQEFFSLMDAWMLPIYYAGPWLALGFYLLLRHGRSRGSRLLTVASLGLAFGGAVSYSVLYNHPNLNPVTGHKVAVPIPKLEGLRESPERAALLTNIVDAYDRNGCANRTFVTFQATPFLYYLFEREPAKGLEYLYYPYIFDSTAALQTLKRSSGWCAFVSWNWLNRPAPQPRPGTEALTDYLVKESARVLPLSPRGAPAYAYDDFVLYVGPR